jgi:hypothetical protein
MIVMIAVEVCYLTPLVRGTTYRRAVFPLLGGLLLAPYV